MITMVAVTILFFGGACVGFSLAVNHQSIAGGIIGIALFLIDMFLIICTTACFGGGNDE